MRRSRRYDAVTLLQRWHLSAFEIIFPRKDWYFTDIFYFWWKINWDLRFCEIFVAMCDCEFERNCHAAMLNPELYCWERKFSRFESALKSHKLSKFVCFWCDCVICGGTFRVGVKIFWAKKVSARIRGKMGDWMQDIVNK